MLSALKECKDKGGKVVAVNPLPEAGLFNFKDPQTVSGVVGGGTPLADEYLQIKVGGDLALFQALGHLLLAEEERNPGTVVDRSFVEAQTDGFEAYREARGELDWAETEKATGLDRGQIEDVAGTLIRSKASIFCWARASRSSRTPGASGGPGRAGLPGPEPGGRGQHVPGPRPAGGQVPASGVPDGERLRRRLLPRGQRPGPQGKRGAGSNTPGFKAMFVRFVPHGG
jgi:hypothetical protein